MTMSYRYFRDRKSDILDKIVEAAICLHIILLFLTKTEGVRNALIFGSFFLFLVSRRRNNLVGLLKDGVARAYFVFIAVILISIANSIDPSYSLWSFKDEPLKGLVLFLMIPAVFDSEKKLKKIAASFAIAATIIVATSYYSYFATNISLLKPDVFYLDLWHGSFARSLCITLPFMAAFAVKARGRTTKTLLLVLLTISSAALVLSTARTAYIAFIAMFIIWLYFLLNRLRSRKAIALVVMVFIAVNCAAWLSSPALRTRVMNIKKELPTMHKRSDMWTAITGAIKEKPVLGWGYGRGIVYKEEPYSGTRHEAPSKPPHSTFLAVTFASGFVGLVSYLVLLIYSCMVLINRTFRGRPSDSFSIFFLLAALSVIVGNYFINSLTSDVSFKELSIVLGIAVASMKIGRENGPKGAHKARVGLDGEAGGG